MSRFMAEQSGRARAGRRASPKYWARDKRVSLTSEFPRVVARTTLLMTVSVIRSLSEIERLAPEWKRLFLQSRTRNPFANPEWLTTWLRHFVSARELYIVAVRSGDDLVGVAPLFRSSSIVPGLPLRRLGLLGTGKHAGITKLPQILAGPPFERKVLRKILAFLHARVEEWDWLEVHLAPELGWFEPEWLPAGGDRRFLHAGASVRSNGASEDVVHPAGTSQARSEGEPRRSRNRFARKGLEWRIESLGAANEAAASSSGS